MYEEDLALNNLQWLISHKTKPNQPLRYEQEVTQGQFLRGLSFS